MSCCCFSKILYWFIGALVIYLLKKYVPQYFLQKKLDRWNNTPKNVIIVHCVKPGISNLSGSPFVVKVLTFLKMANLPFKLDHKDPFGPTSKTPWISLNGEHVGDSQLIIEFLKKKFNKNVNGSYNDEQIAMSSAVRIMLEEHFFWGLALWRFAFGTRESLLKLTTQISWVYGQMIKLVVLWRADSQGIGKHPKEVIHKIMCEDIRITSKLLGKKKFILGNEPCEDDCAIFAFTTQCLWGLDGSPYEKLINDKEMINLKEYTLRMKEKFWPDWDTYLSK